MSGTATPAAPAVDTSSTPTESNAPVAQSGGAPAKSTPAQMPSGGLSKQVASSKPEAEAAPEQTAEQKAEAARRKYKLKVDGEELEEELTDEEITVRLQKERAWNKRQSQLNSDMKKLQELHERGKKDPLAAVKELWGVDPLELARQKLAETFSEDLRKQKLTPEERIREEYEAKLAEERAAREQIEKTQAEREQQERDTRIMQEIQDRFVSALENEGLPKTAETIAEMARVGKMAHLGGYRLTDAQLAIEVRNRIEAREKQLHESVLGGLTGEQLLKRFPAPVLKAVIKAYLEKNKAATAVAPSAPIKRAPPPAPTKPESDNPRQARLRRLGIID